jgi:hypothetical protein
MESAAQRIQADLVKLAAQGANAGQIADTAIAKWRGIDAALSPIIGQRGVSALYMRSLYLTRSDYPWLAAVAEGALQPGDFTALQSALAQQTSAHAAAANGALLQIFVNLLSNLIGSALTERLLRSVWDLPSSGHAEQETTL